MKLNLELYPTVSTLSAHYLLKYLFLIVFRHLKTLQKLVSELTQLKNSMETWQIVLQTSFRTIFTCASK
jgi:hypothetical protein